MKENERKCALLTKEYWSAAKKGTPESALSIGKSGKCRNDKNMDHSESNSWKQLLRATAESNCWEQLLRATAESNCWEQLLRATAESNCWEQLLRATESNCWEQLLRATERNWNNMKDYFWKKMKENVHFSLRNTGVPPRRALQNVHFPLEKVGNAETTKMDHFRMYTFSSRKLWSRRRMCGFHGARVPFKNVHCSLGN